MCRTRLKIARTPKHQLQPSRGSTLSTFWRCAPGKSHAQRKKSAGWLAAAFTPTTGTRWRDTLVPIKQRWNIETMLAALRDYPKVSNCEDITFEYVDAGRRK